ncbi:hypothetical protein EJ06DRAFT_470087 [Trichodelitschia bisporula]|uniref:RFX-type winged-helix domain-containing protein n=1 Tax=Trichodelitschia bisporula TaxID=703511 RepID=A0A6G1I8Z0_9PEZI|nr:hypothetical protein EJ06DRAFT_470087 [Trichodelitschia bisporula]
MEAFHGLPQNADAQSQVQAHQQQQHSSQPAYYAAPNMQFAQSQGMDYQMSNTSSQPGHIAPAGSLDATDRSKRVSNSTATNDKELRDLLRQNDHRSLKDVASEVMATNTTAKAEKSKQLFAMLWLRALCRTAKTSVPRSRVYSTYAEHCGDERVQPLNPASFGKLVRVIFPGIQTRRLGVRGESKYHYVDLALLRDPQEGEGRRRRDTVSSINHAHKPSIDFNSIPPLNADTSVIPTEEQSFPSPTFAPSASASASLDGCVFADPMAVGFHPAGIQTSVTYPQPLLFQPAEPPSQDNDVIQLPDIHSYAPPKTDADAADALSALYRTHCTSLVDCVRFCKEKQFFRLFTSFQGTLTVPVQKLLVHPDIAPWIRECDWLMYQKMIHYVSQLTLQVIPPVAMRFLDTISDNLHGHITKTFHGLPRHVLESKLEPATLFSSLIKRMLKVNQTAHAAARVLIQDECRDQMWRDWVTKVNPKRIMECIVPNCGYEEVYRILTHDVRSILQPLSPELWGIEQGTHYEAAASVPASGATADTVVERIGAFLDSLASRFSHTNARTLINTITALGTAALRDITVEGGHSYNAWWITKVFVDELSIWLASLGGFLEHRPGQAVPQSLTPISNTGTQFPNGEEAGSGEGSRQQSRYSSIDYQPVLAPNTGPSQPEGETINFSYSGGP